MDIQTIENKLKSYEFNNDEEFQEDLKLIWKNAKEFNSPSTEIFQIADRLENETDQLISLPTQKLFQKKEVVRAGSTDRKKREIVQKELTLQEQNELSEQIKQLQGQDLIGVWNIVQNHIGGMQEDKKEFSIKLLPVNVQKELQKYVKTKIKLIESKPKFSL